VVNGEAPAEVFLDALKAEGSRAEKSLNGLLTAIHMQADMPRGRWLSDTRFKSLKGYPGLYAFKSDQLRLFCCFAPGGKIILLNGHSGKKQNETRAAEKASIERAWKLMNGYKATLKT
jgi:hypothetical protein